MNFLLRHALLVLPVSILLSTMAFGTEGSGTVVLTSGERMEKVVFSTNDEYKVLEVYFSEDDVRRFSYNQVASIHDLSGNDITDDVLGGRYSTPEWVDTPRADSVIAAANMRPWNFGLSLGGNFDIPLSEYYQGIESGAGFGVTALIPATDDVVIRAGFDMAGMGFDEDLEAIFGAGGAEIDFTVRRYLIGLEYIFGKNEVLDLPNYWRVYTNLGMISHKIEGTQFDPGTGQPIATINSTEEKFISNLGLGVLLRIGHRVGVDVASELDVVYLGARDEDFTPDPFTNNIETAAILSFRISLVSLL